MQHDGGWRRPDQRSGSALSVYIVNELYVVDASGESAKGLPPKHEVFAGPISVGQGATWSDIDEQLSPDSWVMASRRIMVRHLEDSRRVVGPDRAVLSSRRTTRQSPSSFRPAGTLRGFDPATSTFGSTGRWEAAALDERSGDRDRRGVTYDQPCSELNVRALETLLLE